MSITPDSIFAKTALGRQEVAARAQGLAPLMRALLIMADGKCSLERLSRQHPQGAQLPAMMRQLRELGLVEDVTPRTRPAVAATRQPAERYLYGAR